ncbi:radial spoke head 14 homolog [Sphaeramia orbicularis]|uniref:radial spoke head 14 homolog n=1 Tax=Sphaeramia orbicularis TaxID=375764 RepID=UPI00117E9F82|nr:radial spoke head 14 homolog [Sphaeramia orbicularis]
MHMRHFRPRPLQEIGCAALSRSKGSGSDQLRVHMSGSVVSRTRAPVAFGRRAVPRLFEELRDPDPERRIRTLNSLCDLVHDPERLYQTVTGGFMDQIQVLLKDENQAVRRKTCELLHLLTSHSLGRQSLLVSSLVSPLSQLLDDPSGSCRTSIHRVLNRLALLPAGAQALLPLVPKLMQKLKEDQEDQEEELVLLLSTLSSCCRSDAVPALSLDGVALLRHKLEHQRTEVRRNAAGTMKELSVPLEGKRQICEEAVIPVLAALLLDEDLEVQTNSAGTIMNTVILTEEPGPGGLDQEAVSDPVLSEDSDFCG